MTDTFFIILMIYFRFNVHSLPGFWRHCISSRVISSSDISSTGWRLNGGESGRDSAAVVIVRQTFFYL
jgi:hypothetical protein